MISLTNISKKYGSQFALKPLTLTLPSFKTHVLLGSSGSGKSTILRILTGLVESSTGEALIGEIPVGPEQLPLIAPKIGYVIQEGGLFPHLKACDNVSLAARNQKKSTDYISKRLDELVQMMGFDKEIMDRYPGELSGGQRQRIALMRALMLEPEVIFLDEPLGALDPIVRRSLQLELKNIFSRLQKTVVMVTHDLAEAAFFGDTISLFHEGDMIQHGTFTDLVKNPASEFVRQFISAQTPMAELEVIK
ncbi:ATP-binding cassette domain-containing protein [Candidatus Riflebacteria bacterium]